MSREEIVALLRECPIVASAQADPGTPLDRPETLGRIAVCSQDAGARVFRAQGVQNVPAVMAATGAPCIGIIKRDVPGFAVRITPGLQDVEALIATGCAAISLDGTLRPRPGGETFAELVNACHAAGRLVVADCDTLESIKMAAGAGADFVATTLSGYTEDSPGADPLGLPDIGLVAQAVRAVKTPVIAEGRYAEAWQVEAALRAGAVAVTIGAALNDPQRQTLRLLARAQRAASRVAAFDIGGTWLRFGLFGPEGHLLEPRQVQRPNDHAETVRLIAEWTRESGAENVGIASGGHIVGPQARVAAASQIIPGYTGTVLAPQGLKTVGLNDGLATAWGHACHLDFAGRRVLTLAFGTGVGCGLVDRCRIAGSPSVPPGFASLRLSTGKAVEEELGGRYLGDGSGSARHRALAREAVAMAREVFQPDDVVVCGGVGLTDWFQEAVQGLAVASPYGASAGLYGAAAIALWPPPDVPEEAIE